jgi:hypothetical protein
MTACGMNPSRIAYLILGLLLVVVLALPQVATAARCQVGSLAYSIPKEAAPSQQIKTATTLSGSCASTGEDYYSIRVDLIDVPSSLIISSNSTPIGYNADNFTVTVENMVTTPSNNGTWHLNIEVYVIRAGGTSGFYLLDFSTSSNATIQIGGFTPVPEYPILQGFTAAIAVWIAAFCVRRRRKTQPFNH